MTALYAQLKHHVQRFLVCSAFLVLAACGPTAGSPWGGGYGATSGIVTNDPSKTPDMSWQTTGDRKELNAQSDAIEKRPGLTTVKDEVPVRKVTAVLLLPLTGKNADLGQSMLKAAQLALFDVGSAGFELVPKDTKSTREGVVAAAQDAVVSHADIILGPIFADDVKAIKSTVAGSNIPVVAFTTDWTLAGGNTYIMGFLPFAQVSRVADYARLRGVDRFAVYAPQTPYCDIVVSTLQKSGVAIVKTERYSPQQGDTSGLVADFAETSRLSGGLAYQGLMLPVGGEGLKSLVSQLEQNGVSGKNVRFLGTGLWDDTALMNDPALFGGWFAAPDPKSRADFEKRYQENYGDAPLRLASLAYDATALAAVLGRTAEANAPVYSKERMTNPRGFAGIDGIFRFHADGMAERGLAVLEVQSGKPRVLDPAPTAFQLSGS